MEDGIILVDTERGKEIGFTSDRFSGDSYLWVDGDRILISLIFSRHPGSGHLSELFRAIEGKGFRIAVPTPFNHMQVILRKKGFLPHLEDSELGLGDCEVWEKPHE